MSNSESAAPLSLPELRRALAVDAPAAFDGLEWEEVNDVYFVKFPAVGASGDVDTYLTKWTFFHYPAEPPHVTFVNPETKEYDATGWPDASNDRVALNPVYGDAPEGLICNSMFYNWYYYGGHGDQPAVSWKPGVHKAIATVIELRQLLRQPHYRGPR